MHSFKLPKNWKPSRRGIVISLAALVLIFLGSVTLMSSKDDIPEPDLLSLPEGEAGKVGEVLVSEQALELAEIKVATAEIRSVREKITALGLVQTGGNQIAKVTPQVGGEVAEIFVFLGEDVAKGDVLARLVSPDLARAQADYRQAAARAEVYRADLARRQNLAKLGQYGSAELEESLSLEIEAERGLFTARRSVAEKQAELAEAKSTLKVLENRLAQARAELKVKQAHYYRAKSLPDVVALQTLERLRADFEKAESDVATAEARIDQGKSRLDSAHRSLEAVQAEQPLAQKELGLRRDARVREERVFSGSYSRDQELIAAEAALSMALVERDGASETVQLLGGTPGGGSDVLLRSPIAGRVDTMALTLGENVDSEHLAFTVVNLEEIWVSLAVAPKDLSKLTIGDEVELMADSSPEKPFLGHITSMGSTADEVSKTVPVLVKVEQPGSLLTAGSYVKAVITTEVRHERLTVPNTALQEHTGRATLYVAEADKKGGFEVRHVTLGEKGEDWREISEGLKPGESLATQGTFYLKSEALKSSLSDGCCAVGN